MEKVVIFDWGGVVENHENNLQDLNDAKVRVIKRFNPVLSSEEILKRWCYRTPTGVLLGATNNEDDIKNWVAFLSKRMEINVSFEEFKKAYEEEFSYVRYYKEVVSFAHSLRGKCKLVILSDLTPFDKKRIDDQYDLSKFDKVYLSFEMALRKNNERIYEYVLNDLKVNPENILFIDDDVNNIMLAKKCRWNTCQAFGYELDKIKREVNEFLGK